MLSISTSWHINDVFIHLKTIRQCRWQLWRVAHLYELYWCYTLWAYYSRVREPSNRPIVWTPGCDANIKLSIRPWSNTGIAIHTTYSERYCTVRGRCCVFAYILVVSYPTFPRNSILSRMYFIENIQAWASRFMGRFLRFGYA